MKRKSSMEEKSDAPILAIESSCDETAAAVVKNGRKALSNIIFSQIDLHTLYGGVAPGIASRKHIEKTALREAVKKACESALCADNAAMIGAAAYYEYRNGTRHGLDLNAVPNLRLGER